MKKTLIAICIILLAVLAGIYFLNRRSTLGGFGALSSDHVSIRKIIPVGEGNFQIRACGPSTIEGGYIISSYYILGDFTANEIDSFKVFDSKGDFSSMCDSSSGDSCQEIKSSIPSCSVVFDTRYDW